MRITSVTPEDIRFPTSRNLDGSDAMNPAPDYSLTYVVLGTDEGTEGHGFTFTIGRGNELCVAAVNSLAHLVLDLDVDEAFAEPAATWRRIVGDSQLRWLGPEKGVIHLAGAALVNALWDLRARQLGKPLWKLLSDLSPEQLVDCVDFRHLQDVLDRDAALDLLRKAEPARAERERELQRSGIPAYTTSAGWLGYPEEEVRRRVRAGLEEGWRHFKLKVGRELEDDRRRVATVREEIGPDGVLMLDANQVWEVPVAIEWVNAVADFSPLWIEEPTSPDDVRGHARIAEGIAPVGVATGEHVHNRVMFKQFLEAGAMAYCQLDACRLGGVNEAIAVILLARRFDVPICPHAGGVGLSEYVQHLAMFDHVAVSGARDDRLVEYVDHLHEHFVDPVRVEGARYLPPARAGYSAELDAASRRAYRFPEGSAWRAR
ncbi:fuconate dehydratase [Egibacter rhizosphaerae]|uniref:L-fuconate dehydratase n=1 Tax=Egibacter rhizosphaerae TaxID=1670831 RepID=A0A411YBM6_9ACTN|nr:enolase C-terminal domain-like protein [Egibacter rhizosphaerae]QBI18557.1 fuconate dehydratase [Egibacter rhizosphaerae]